jgi:hypothetical protein
VTPTASAREQLESALAGVRRLGTEASFKLSPGRITTDRRLIGIEKQHLPRARLLAIADALSIPPEHRAAVVEAYDRSNFFYFACEDEPGAATLRLYLEFPVYIAPLTADELASADASRPSLQMVGFKWLTAGGKPLPVTNYVWHVHLSKVRVAQRIDALRGTLKAPALALSRDLVLRSPDADPPAYIEATESGSPRASFDLNVYSANLRVSDAMPALSALANDYAIDAERFKAVLHAASNHPLGHLSAGLDRQSRDFLTIYYET